MLTGITMSELFAIRTQAHTGHGTFCLSWREDGMLKD